jgi:hypothetical protein
VTTYERFTVLLGVLQLVVSGLGFIVVTWTLRVLVRSIDAQSSAGVAARQMEVEKVILAYPALYRYFYEGHELDSEAAEYARAIGAAQMLASHFDGFFQQRGMYRQLWPEEKWERYIEDHVRKSPALRGFVSANQSWYSPEFVKLCRAVGEDSSTANQTPHRAPTTS